MDRDLAREVITAALEAVERLDRIATALETWHTEEVERRAAAQLLADRASDAAALRRHSEGGRQ